MQEYYPTKEAARDYFARLRWGGKPVCPHCRATEFYTTKRGIYQCAVCFRDFSVNIGTFMGDSLLPLRKWIRAIFLITSHKGECPPFSLARTLGFRKK